MRSSTHFTIRGSRDLTPQIKTISFSERSYASITDDKTIVGLAESRFAAIADFKAFRNSEIVLLYIPRCND